MAFKIQIHRQFPTKIEDDNYDVVSDCFFDATVPANKLLPLITCYFLSKILDDDAFLHSKTKKPCRRYLFIFLCYLTTILVRTTTMPNSSNL